ncbi:MAG: LutC/YkgG family protein [Candidatus Rokuibacteriota bacterium]
MTRAEFLARIRGEVARARPLFAAVPSERPTRAAEQVEVLCRELRERWPATLERFRREFERVGGVFHRVGRLDEVPDAVAGLARAQGMRRLVAWHAEALGGDLVGALAGRGLEALAMPSATPDAAERARLRETIASAELGLTSADLAVAESGSLVLVSGAGRPRSTSLLPACHVALFDRDALVESLAQVGLILEAWHERVAPPTRGAVITFITGPSRTADIELTLTRGVHGPKDVHAVFVEDGLGARDRV